MQFEFAKEPKEISPYAHYLKFYIEYRQNGVMLSVNFKKTFCLLGVAYPCSY